MQDIHRQTNQSLWDGWTDIHLHAPMYRVAAFKAGACHLHDVERREVGDVAGKSLLHLQCHFGLDTLSWARLGAEATGVDFSPRAIAVARSLSAELAIPAQFVCSDLYALPDVLVGRFDIVFTSYGVILWLPDLVAWARVIAHFLKPGGRFHIVEFHPILFAFDEQRTDGRLVLRYPYFHQAEPIVCHNQGSYADPSAPFTHTSYEWTHSLADVVNALIAAGLRITHLNEFPYCVFNILPGMVQDPKGWWHLVEEDGQLPLMFSLAAVKE